MKTISELESAVNSCYPAAPAFRAFTIKDINHMSGGVKDRIVHVPNESMTFLNKLLVKKLRELTRGKMPNAHGGMKGLSLITAIECHRKKNGEFRRYRRILDLKNAFQQVKSEKLASILYDLDHTYFESIDCTLLFLRKYCMTESALGLVVGGGVSPDLFNTYCEFTIDRKLRALCDAHSLVYTRFIDDLQFSSNQPIGHNLRKSIKDIILSEELTVNDKKTRLYDLKKNPVVINGLTLHLDGKISIPRSYLARVRGIVYRARYSRSVNYLRVRGMVNVIRHISKGRQRTKTEQKILNEFEKILV